MTLYVVLQVFRVTKDTFGVRYPWAQYVQGCRFPKKRREKRKVVAHQSPPPFTGMMAVLNQKDACGEYIFSWNLRCSGPHTLVALQRFVQAQTIRGFFLEEWGYEYTAYDTYELRF